MYKCLSPERGERSERLHFRDGVRRIAEKLADSFSRTELMSIEYGKAGLKLEGVPEDGPRYKMRLLRVALKKEITRRMGTIYG